MGNYRKVVGILLLLLAGCEEIPRPKPEPVPVPEPPIVERLGKLETEARNAIKRYAKALAEYSRQQVGKEPKTDLEEQKRIRLEAFRPLNELQDEMLPTIGWDEVQRRTSVGFDSAGK